MSLAMVGHRRLELVVARHGNSVRSAIVHGGHEISGNRTGSDDSGVSNLVRRI